MTPRPRLASDADILAATARAIDRVGPVDLTLAEVAGELGISPATLVQRFGSKRGLLLRLAASFAESVDQCFEAARSKNASPLTVLLNSFDSATCGVQSPESLANHLAFLQIDLTDADFHRYAYEGGRKVEAGVAALLNEAIAAGEMIACDASRLARVFCATYHGSMVAWAIYRQGKLQPWLRRDLETLLEPYRTKPKRGKRGAVK